MLITDSKFFCEELNTEIPALRDIADTFRQEGLQAAEKQLADYVRAAARPDDYFKIPYYPRENAWAYQSEDDFTACERIMKGNLMSCGFAYQFPDGKVDWKHNPTDNGYREWTRQLSRHHEWRCLAHCYRETGDEKYAKAFVRFLMSWCEQAECPENVGGGATECWRTIEAGIRMTKIWQYAFHAFLKSPEFNDHVLCTYMKSIWEHGYRLRGFCTGANWLIMEMAGLAHIGMIYPWLRKAEEWKEYAFQRLSTEIDVQVYPDGFQYELSTGYHGVVISNYRYVIDTAKALGIPLPEIIKSSLERAFEMYIKLSEPDRFTPDLNDGGKANAVSELKLGAEYFPERSEFVYFATDGKEGKEPPYKSIALPYSGMASMRTGWGRDDMWFFMESAPFGKGHQHEDKLQVLMYAYGKEVIKDTGNYAYDTSEMRKFAIDTRSHNCAMVDDKSQNRRGRYKWNPEDITKLSDLKWGFTEDVDTAEGIYSEGYGPEYIDVTHRRKVIFFKKGVNGSLPFALVIDRLTSGDGKPHKYAVSYQMNTQPYTVSDKTFTADFGDNVTMSIVGSDAPEIVIAQKEPYMMGWRPKHAPGGTEPEHYHAPCVRFVTENAMEKRLVTALYPSNNGSIAIKDIIISDDVNDTALTLVFENGDKVTLSEKDYPAGDK